MPDEKEIKTDDTKKKLEELERQKEEYLAGWQRARADLMNYKKEEMERIGELLKYANEEFVLKVLPILDNFEIVEKKIADNLRNDENIKGLLLIKKQIQDFLKAQGVEEIAAVGKNFDPNFMEAVAKEEEERKGYKINGRLLRPAKVKINK